MILLNKASLTRAPWLDKGREEYFGGLNPFKQMNLKLKVDDHTQLDGFPTSTTIVFGEDKRKKIQFEKEVEKIDETNFEKYSTASGVGDLYKLKSQKSQANDFFTHLGISYPTDVKLDQQNVLYLKKPDGIYSVYSYLPDIYEENRVSATLPYIYTHQVFGNCSGDSADFLDVIDLKVKETSLKVAAKTFDGDSLYTPPDDMLKVFFDYYLKVDDSQYINDEDGGSGLRTYLEKEKNVTIEVPEDFKQFKKMTPMLLWKSPLGQWIRLVRVRFLQPKICD